jgi:hypothetical protein
MLHPCPKNPMAFENKRGMVKIGRCKGESISNGKLRKNGQGLIFM